MRQLTAAVFAFGLCLLAIASPQTGAQTRRKPLDPCKLVSNADVLHVLGWEVATRRHKPYDIHGATGAMCFLAASQGQVIVIVPSPESDLPGITVYNDPAAGDLAKRVYGLGADVILYNSTVYVAGYHRDVEVRVVPDSHAASYAEVEGFGAVVARSLRRLSR
ncbi:MAG: hypothetical protein M3R53_10085 [Candidatus Eremiobacteraeota bacterium]|nr:hypothetical protein [Candidatus Eremiobacteraeota bacterium]